MAKPGKRAQLREDRAVLEALWALETFDHLQQRVSVDALKDPRTLVRTIAATHSLLINATDQTFRGFVPLFVDHVPSLSALSEQLPPLTSEQLEGFRRIVLEPGEYCDASGPLPRLAVKPQARLQRLFVELPKLEALRAADYWQRWEGRRTRLLAEWCFSDHPECSALAAAASWMRYYLALLAVRAAEILAQREISLLRSFLAPALGHLLPHEQRMEVRRWSCEAETPSDAAMIALCGRSEVVHRALRETGVAALEWPWLRRVVESWRRIVCEEDVAEDHRAVARKNLKIVGEALGRIGKGRTTIRTLAERRQRKGQQDREAKALMRLKRSFARNLPLFADRLQASRQALGEDRAEGDEAFRGLDPETQARVKKRFTAWVDGGRKKT